ncbi:SDR family oxidoreductase [Phormidium yuhuli AB48]|uniref:SDR family oxidoreductase n=1 Tax=Phormidium yuhuli AB48 TaxID=2940671 RepID=A0ABY5AMB0_9CYAN|nr:SDR family oxidoreductase [Phormidium yuhuli]USR89950.1 SDR family oxidoreductase [Phormidium yuhuli AB48]
MPRALITGASSGIGAEFARQLAPQGYDLVLTARSQAPLETLAADLRQRHSIDVEVIPLDLTDPEAPSQLYQQTCDRQLQIDLLINNAGYGDYGDFAEGDRQKLLGMVQLNISALTDLTYQFLQPMRSRQSGTILNIGSIGGFQPIPYLALYAATKAFVLSFSEALWAENKDLGLKVMAICPGPTATAFNDVAGFPKTELANSAPELASVESVVSEALKAMKRQSGSAVVGGWANHLITSIPRLLPRDTIAQVIGEQFRPKSQTPD